MDKMLETSMLHMETPSSLVGNKIMRQKDNIL
jgi:hypothetical protein